MSNVYFSLFYPISYPEDFYVDMPIKVCLLPQLMVKPGNLLSILNPTTLSYIILHYPTPSYTILHHPTPSYIFHYGLFFDRRKFEAQVH